MDIPEAWITTTKKQSTHPKTKQENNINLSNMNEPIGAH